MVINMFYRFFHFYQHIYPQLVEKNETFHSSRNIFMSTVTVFSSPKPFLDPHIRIIQRNAICSWKALGENVDVILIGDEPGLAETASEIGVRFELDVARNEYGTPLVHSLFQQARQSCKSEILIYINADIILLPDILEVIKKIQQLEKDFLIVGHRWDIDISHELNFDDNWSEELIELINNKGKQRAPTAMDYFVFPRNLFQDIPPFAIGRAGWDNWMIYYAVHQPWPVIDITPSLKVIHQNHDYSHLPDGKPHYDLEESNQNVALSGGMKTLYDLLDVNLTFKNDVIQRKGLTLARSLRKLERLVMPEEKEGWRWSLTRKLRKLRKRLTKKKK